MDTTAYGRFIHLQLQMPLKKHRLANERSAPLHRQHGTLCSHLF